MAGARSVTTPIRRDAVLGMTDEEGEMELVEQVLRNDRGVALFAFGRVSVEPRHCKDVGKP